MKKDDTKNTERSNRMQNLIDALIDLHEQRINQVACIHCSARAASAQDVNNAMKFLKENGFGIDPIKDADALDDLAVAMRARRPGLPKLPSEQEETLPS